MHILKHRDNNPSDHHQWFVFDSRTKTIRSYVRRNYSMRTHSGWNGYAVMAPFRGQVYEQMKFNTNSRYRSIQNAKRRCLAVHSHRNIH